MTSTRRQRARQVRIIPSRAIRTLRQVNDELLLASEAIIRSARGPQRRPRAKASANEHPYSGSATERATERAA